MIISSTGSYLIRVHLTNVVGAGATQLLQSLLPALESVPGLSVEEIYLPSSGQLAQYRSSNSVTSVHVYERLLPNAISRFLECTCLASRFNGESPLLVMGDLPLRCSGPQIVFVHQPNLVKPLLVSLARRQLRDVMGNIVFRLNLDKVGSFIVQTDVMREALVSCFPGVNGRVHVLPQPVPAWLLSSRLERHSRLRPHGSELSLFYPAAGYPHKNHLLLSKINPLQNWPVSDLQLTLSANSNPSPHVPWVKCVGNLLPSEMIRVYSHADALLFLSKEESYGFPLVEAMFIGLPIVCPDLPYAKTLCGDQAIYFDPDCPDSLLAAIFRLKSMLDQGWWPFWAGQLKSIPSDWDTVAAQMLNIAKSS